MTPKILLVDRDPDTRAILAAVFERKGFEVYAAADGVTGLRLLEEHAPDVVLGDFPMDVPGHSPFTAHAPENAASRPLVVSFTTRVMPEEMEAARAVSDTVVTKPADPIEVVAEVERLLAER